MPAVMCIADTRQNPSSTPDASTIVAIRSVTFTSSRRARVLNQRYSVCAFTAMSGDDRVRLDLDQRPVVDEAAHLDERAGRADVAEEVAVHRRRFRRLRDVGD